ncbi:orotidine-5'-phosphate decarboxylase [Pueribacillus theae]|uniref:Orotidine 5'-phosphate decarboxylase n=1 Tax=Pueribacillus theae TaxID=2171751 RepID=A0A2U1K878_9BACI|nr:orotidine-5'-phosphate decarboxylase [Pueribacillus theae]PWA13439.1 orotidine-5'-phosphate decarboxylase [Pueribacillus theae]
MNQPIIALDFPSMDSTDQFLSQFDREKLYVKVGMQLFYKEGPNLIKKLKEAGHWIFLDLKLHDIPNTVKEAMKSLATLHIDMVNVHAAGGKKMMEAAMEGLEAGTAAGRHRPLCIAVTQLTSTSEKMLKEELLINSHMEEAVLHYAKLTKEAGLDGIVSSALEVPLVKEKITDFITVTPGIRLPGDKADDQTRIVTPEKARKLGSDFIVVGRSVTKSGNPLEAYERVVYEWNN